MLEGGRSESGGWWGPGRGRLTWGQDDYCWKACEQEWVVGWRSLASSGPAAGDTAGQRGRTK